ncbi:carbohydrate ABC transporter permease [Streptomyces misionensis]|uniref:carbohydrate ABC transporter permease n=1 Tax=Streptomyces misionensis TaxID=67331 RepID=UPI003410D3BC
MTIAPPTASVSGQAGLDTEKLFNRVALGTVIAFALLWLAPLAWALATSVRSNADIANDPTAWFSKPTLSAYTQLLKAGNLPRWYLNSAITSTLTTVLTVGLGSMAGFALSRMRFRGRGALTALIVAGVMIPPQALMIPQYREVAATGLLGSYWAVTLPQVPNVIAVIVFKQFFDGLPIELIEAARMDGASWPRIYRQICMPLSKPAVSAVTIFSFVWAWNNFLWPLLATTSADMMTLPVGLGTVQDTYGINYAQMMASAVLGGLPLLFVFLLFQRRIVEGIAGTGIK